MAQRTAGTWTKEQALAAAQKSAAVRRLRSAERKPLLAKALPQALSSPESLAILIPLAYRELSKLRLSSPAAERLSRTLLNLEQIRRIHSKAGKQQTSAPAVPQQGPIGIDESEPAQDNGEPIALPGDSDPPDFAPIE